MQKCKKKELTLEVHHDPVSVLQGAANMQVNKLNILKKSLYNDVRNLNVCYSTVPRD